MLNYFFSAKIENAIRLSSYWHQDQWRNDGEFEYFTHPVAVAMILARAGFDEDVISAAFCHDLLEDTDCPEDEIIQTCGEKVLSIVKSVTEDIDMDESKQWEDRKKKYIENVRNGSPEAKAVCTADKIHNLQNLIAAIEEHGLVYFENFHRGPEEKLWFEDHVCMMLVDTWHHPLVEEYDKLVNKFVDLLESLDSSHPNGIEIAKKTDTIDFDEPAELEQEEEISGSIEKVSHPITSILSSNEIEAKRKVIEENLEVIEVDENETIQEIKYLNDEEFMFLLPGALRLGITQGFLKNDSLQKTLGINYLTAHRILKELKRLRVIKRADSFQPRPVDKKIAKDLLEDITNQ